MYKKTILAVAVAAACCTAHAADREDAVVVTASPFDNHNELEMAQPVSVLRGERLQRKQSTNLGETLATEPGVHSSSFGPGAGRPIIRGLDGPRIRVMDNGLGTSDLSTISPDHQVTGDPANAGQIEVLRGPATLLYGSGAIGGLVNVVNNRIPDSRTEGLHGTVTARGATGLHESAGSFALDGGQGELAWHLDGFKRKTGDYAIPGRQELNNPASATGRLPNSFTDSEGMSIGGSFIGERGRLGASFQQQGSRYGIPTPDNSQIDMQQHRFDINGELLDPLRGLSKARIKLRESRYRHDEIESTGLVGTSFMQDGGERRVELTHVPIAGWTGVFGFQNENKVVEAQGSEAIIPRTRSMENGLFLVEDVSWRDFHFELGARSGKVTRKPDGANPDRQFGLSSYSAGTVWNFTRGYGIAATYTTGQRAPATEELYSNGPHVATGTFELGDPTLNKEQSRNIDVQLRKTEGAFKGKIGVFQNRIRNYIFATDVDTDGDGVADRTDEGGVLTPGGDFLLVNYVQAQARFRGVEGEVTYRPAPTGFAMRMFGDRAEGRLTGGGNLPRISPARLGFEPEYKTGPWTGYATVLRVYRQDRVATLETATPGYTRLDAGIEYLLNHTRQVSTTLFLRGNNLTNQDMRVHTSFIKDFAPLPGRSIVAGARLTF